MILDVFDNLWKWLTDLSDQAYDFIMKSYSEPFFWIIMFGVLLLIGIWAINTFANK